MLVRLATGCVRTLIVVTGGREVGGSELRCGTGIRTNTVRCTLKLFYELTGVVIGYG